jgi:hypothetical protein
VRGDVATFSDPTWRQYALDAIDEMRTYKFVFSSDGTCVTGKKKDGTKVAIVV